MNMLIQGTNGGYNVFYPTRIGTSPFSAFAEDERSLFHGRIGWQVYAVAIVKNGCILSKYNYVLDIKRAQGTPGYVSFSVFISENNPMPKGRAKKLLDELSDAFFKKNVNEDEDYELDSVGGCDYLEDIVRNYGVEDENPDIDNLRDNYAFVECDNADEISKYLDNPFQSEYEKFKRVFVVEKEFKECLTHAENDLTGMFDVENTRYKLNFDYYANSAEDRFEMEVGNGIKKNHRGRIFRKDIIKIKYSKKQDASYFETIIWEGKLSDESANKYFMIDEDKGTVTVRRIVLQPKTTEVQIVVEDEDGKKVEDAELKVTRSLSNKLVEAQVDGSYLFKGTEMKEMCAVKAYKGVFSDFKEFKPENTSEVKLCLKEHKVVKIIVKDEVGVELNRASVVVESNSGTVNSRIPSITKTNNQFEFVGKSQIAGTYTVHVSADGYESYTYQMCPADVENNQFCTEVLIKNTYVKQSPMPDERPKNKKVRFDNKKGKYENCPNEIDNKSRLETPKARIGWKFVEWKEVGYTIEAIFEETWFRRNRYKLLSAALVVLIFAFVIWLVCLFTSQTPNIELTAFEAVEDSINQCDNDLEKLNQLKSRWDSYKPEVSRGTLGFGTPDSTSYKAWSLGLGKIIATIKPIKELAEEKKKINDYLEGAELKLEKLNQYINGNIANKDSVLKGKIEYAICLRNNLNKGKINDVIEMKYPYSKSQQNLKQAIDMLEKPEIIDKASKMMRKAKISEMSLDEIADTIKNTIQNIIAPLKKTNEITGARASASASTSTGDKNSKDKKSLSAKDEFWQTAGNKNLKKNIQYANLLIPKFQSEGKTNCEEYEFLKKLVEKNKTGDTPYFNKLKNAKADNYDEAVKNRNINELKILAGINN